MPVIEYLCERMFNVVFEEQAKSNVFPWRYFLLLDYSIFVKLLKSLLLIPYAFCYFFFLGHMGISLSDVSEKPVM